MKTFARIAFRNVVKNWRHSLAAIISISAGFISIVIFQGYIIDVGHMYVVGFTNRAMYGDLLVENPELENKEGRLDPMSYFLDESGQLKLQTYLDKHRDQVKSRVRFLPASGMVSNGRNSLIFLALGYDVPEGLVTRADVWAWDALYGQPLHVAGDPNGVMLGQSLGHLLGCEPVKTGEQLVQNKGYKAEVRPFHCAKDQVQLTATTESGQMNAIDLNVVGLLDGGYRDVDEKWMKTSIANTQMLLNTKKVRHVSILLNDGVDVAGFRSDLNSYFQGEGLPYRAVRWQDHPFGEFYQKTMSFLNIFNVFIVVVIMTISGLSVFNTMIKIAKERTKEIGTMRSLGFTGRVVSLVFMFEALFLSGFGILIGAVSGLIFTALINHAGITYRAGLLSEPVLFKIAISFSSYLESLILLSVLSVVTSWIATRHIVRGQIAENLTYA